MKSAPAPIFGAIGKAVLFLAFLSLSAWSGMGLWFHAGGAGPWRIGAIVAWFLMLLAAGRMTIRRRRIGAVLLTMLILGFGGWWWTIKPRLDRDWAPDVARTVTGNVMGDVVTLLNVRNFRWKTESEAEERWNWRKYDLSKLVETDLVLSYWGINAIAHTLVSFGFSDGRRVVFSVEIRHEQDEEFSSVAGFFKAYELALIASEESDILFLRTNMRGEDTYLYPLELSPEAMRALFLSYVEKGNELARGPAFYNTLTANCTTVIFDLVRAIEPGIPTDWRILLSGYLPGYLVDHDATPWKLPEADLRRRAAISTKAKADRGDVPYSDAIRNEVPDHALAVKDPNATSRSP